MLHDRMRPFFDRMCLVLWCSPPLTWSGDYRLFSVVRGAALEKAAGRGSGLQLPVRPLLAANLVLRACPVAPTTFDLVMRWAVGVSGPRWIRPPVTLVYVRVVTSARSHACAPSFRRLVPVRLLWTTVSCAPSLDDCFLCAFSGRLFRWSCLSSGR